MSTKKKVIVLSSFIAVVVLTVLGYFAYYRFAGKDIPISDIAFTVDNTEKEADTAKTTEYADPHAGMEENRLNGKWISKNEAKKRPVAIMINNIKEAIPQSGISKADVIYEILAEGGITRLMALYSNYNDMAKIGPVRSARHYYCDIANEYDAIYVHYGQTKYAVSKMNELKLDRISGLDYVDGTIFYRDNSRVAPHNAYISTKGINQGIETEDISKKRSSAVKSHFIWNEKAKKLNSDKSGKKVTLGFSTYTSPYFVYSNKLKKYKRYQYGVPHIDDQNNQQLVFTNIIVQKVKEWNIDRNGYQTMKLTGQGKGYYLTRGKRIPITWKRSKNGITKYYEDNGKQIRLNKGKTYIAVYPNDRSDNIEFE